MNKEEIFTDRGFTNMEQMAEMFDYYKKEVERLNNIINEIEKLCIDNLVYDELGMKVLDQPFILDKIKELKGSDKE